VVRCTSGQQHISHKLQVFLCLPPAPCLREHQCCVLYTTRYLPKNGMYFSVLPLPHSSQPAHVGPNRSGACSSRCTGIGFYLPQQIQTIRLLRQASNSCLKLACVLTCVNCCYDGVPANGLQHPMCQIRSPSPDTPLFRQEFLDFLPAPSC